MLLFILIYLTLQFLMVLLTLSTQKKSTTDDHTADQHQISNLGQFHSNLKNRKIFGKNFLNFEKKKEMEEEKKEEERYPYETSAYLVHFDDILKCQDILCEELKNRIVRRRRWTRRTTTRTYDEFERSIHSIFENCKVFAFS